MENQDGYSQYSYLSPWWASLLLADAHPVMGGKMSIKAKLSKKKGSINGGNPMVAIFLCLVRLLNE